MKKLILLSAFLLAGMMITLMPSCDEEEDDGINVIILTDAEHHIGDNDDAEGKEWQSTFTISSGYTTANLSVSFVYPNSTGTSGVEVDYPPDIYVNGTRVGMEPTDFPSEPGCVSSGEYVCTFAAVYDVAAILMQGQNTFRIVATGVYDDDDFVFADVKIIWTK